ncbi:MAG: phage head-tail connector protein [Spirochaetaceae bacterium]|jgi:hypothetical protein|nr:phage head-tail connector protein [Spirochaetaceae bacterium]
MRYEECKPCGKATGGGRKPHFHSLIPLEHFKLIMGIDDREDELARYCLEAASSAIEGYCRRKLMARKVTETLTFEGDFILTLREYPVREVLGVWLTTVGTVKTPTQPSPKREEQRHPATRIVEPDFYNVWPDCGDDVDLPFVLELSQGLKLVPGISAVRVMYRAGYRLLHVPSDLGSACLELAMWNYTRWRGKKAGVVTTGMATGAGRGRQAFSGVPVEKFEAAMPENVRMLLEPYRRKMI